MPARPPIRDLIKEAVELATSRQDESVPFESSMTPSEQLTVRGTREDQIQTEEPPDEVRQACIGDVVTETVSAYQ